MGDKVLELLPLELRDDETIVVMDKLIDTLAIHSRWNNRDVARALVRLASYILTHNHA